MRLTKYDWAQTQVPWSMRDAQPRRQSRDPNKPRAGLMANPKYVADLNSEMPQRDVAEKWSVSQPTVSKHRMELRREAEL